ncbi:MAG TPA: SigE family RNA polymerase sigma factor [Streptosporangiaceae bacterium]|nr:SigE family RNA polymerase sigma factor [Streptosporangiaceae bacterium]
MLGRFAGVKSKQTEFAEFYEATRDECLRIVLLNVGNLALAEDLVAEGFTRAWTGWRTVRDHPAPRAWVIKTALNTHVSWWRRRRRETSLDGYDTAGAADLLSTLDRSMVTALRRLPVRQRQVVALRLLLDLDNETTAQTLGISPGTVSSHLHRALGTLRGDAAIGGWRGAPGGGGRRLVPASLAETGDH